MQSHEVVEGLSPLFQSEHRWPHIYSLVDGACGESADNPAQVQGLEGDDNHADIFWQFFEALGVNEVMGRFAPDVRFKPNSGSTVHPATQKEEEREKTSGGELHPLFPWVLAGEEGGEKESLGSSLIYVTCRIKGL